MLRFFAVLAGIGFIFAGVAGYLPQFTTNGLLLGIFQVDAMHNMIHIASGVLAIMAATSYKSAKWFFILFGIIYAVVTGLGFYWNGDFAFLWMQMNMADNYLHLGIAVVFLLLGFTAKRNRA